MSHILRVCLLFVTISSNKNLICQTHLDTRFALRHYAPSSLMREIWKTYRFSVTFS